MEFMVYIWLGIICIGLMVEALNVGTLVSIWFSAGAVVPLIMSFFKVDSVGYLTAQIIVFGISTSLCLIFLRGITKKVLFTRNEKTNLDLMVGEKLKIIKKYEDVPYVKFNGIEYRVVVENEEEVEIGDFVKLVKFQGNKAIVKKI